MCWRDQLIHVDGDYFQLLSIGTAQLQVARHLREFGLGGCRRFIQFLEQPRVLLGVGHENILRKKCSGGGYYFYSFSGSATAYECPPPKALACRSWSSSGVRSSWRVAMDQRK